MARAGARAHLLVHACAARQGYRWTHQSMLDLLREFVVCAARQGCGWTHPSMLDLLQELICKCMHARVGLDPFKQAQIINAARLLAGRKRCRQALCVVMTGMHVWVYVSMKTRVHSSCVDVCMRETKYLHDVYSYVCVHAYMKTNIYVSVVYSCMNLLK